MRRVLFDTLRRIYRPDGSNLLVVVVTVGLVGSLIASAYVGLLRLLTAVIEPNLEQPLRLLLITTGAGALISLLTYLLGDPGNTEVLVNNVHLTGGPSDIRRNRSMLPVSLISVASGGSAGPEAPLVQLTGSLGVFIGRHTMPSLADRRTVTIAGMGVGFSVLFGEPLGGALFALEILHRKGVQYYEAILPALVSSGIGFLAYTGLTRFGLAPVWHFPQVRFGGWTEGGIAAGLSVCGALVAIGFGIVLHYSGRWLRRIPRWARPVLGGLGIGLIGWLQPLTLYFSEEQLNKLLDLHLAIGTLLALAALKVLSISITVGSGWRGGFIIPLFFIGAALGQAAARVLPISPALAMLVLMASINVGVTKTPVSTVIVLTTLTGTSAVPVLLLACISSLLITSRWTVIESQQDRPLSLGKLEPLRADDRGSTFLDELELDVPTSEPAAEGAGHP